MPPARDEHQASGSGARLFALYLTVHGALALWFVFGSPTVGPGPKEGFPLDDAWIHMVYARSFANGEGFTYNLGEQEAGFTSFLWVVSLAPALWLSAMFGNLVMWVKLTGVLIATSASYLGHRVTEALTRHAALAWLCGLALALDPGLAFAQVAGMEVPLSIAATLLGALGMIRADARMAGIGLAMAALARPELAIWTALGMAGVGHQLLRGHTGIGGHEARPTGRRAWVWLLAPSAVGASLWVGFCLYATGRPLPNTFYVKYSTLESDFGNSVDVLLNEMLPRVPIIAGGICTVVVLAGIIKLLRPDERLSIVTRTALALYPLIFFLLLVNVHQLVMGDAYYWSRYAQPIMGLLAVLIAVGAGALWEFKNTAKSKHFGLIARVLLCFYLGTAALVSVPRLQEDATRYATDCQSLHDMQVHVGKMLRENSDPDDVVATVDAGAVRYFSDRRVIDIRGLNSQRVLKDGFPTVEAELKPRFSVLFRAEFVLLPSDGSRRLVLAAETDNYTICRCDQEVIFVVERAWTQDDKGR